MDQSAVAADFQAQRRTYISHTIKLMEEYGEILKRLGKEQRLYTCLIVHQAVVSREFEKFHEAWKKTVNEDIRKEDTRLRLREIHTDVAFFHQELRDHEDESQSWFQRVTKLTTDYQGQCSELGKILSTCTSATSSAQLEGINLRSFEEFKIKCPVPEFVRLLLEKDWTRFSKNINADLNEYIRELQQLSRTTSRISDVDVTTID